MYRGCRLLICRGAIEKKSPADCRLVMEATKNLNVQSFSLSLFIPSLFCNQFKGIQRIKHFFMYTGNFFLFHIFVVFFAHCICSTTECCGAEFNSVAKIFSAFSSLYDFTKNLLLTKWPFSCLVLLDCFPFNFNFYCNFFTFFSSSLSLLLLLLLLLMQRAAVVCAFKMINSIKNWNAKILCASSLSLSTLFRLILWFKRKKADLFRVSSFWWRTGDERHCGCVLFERHH